MKVRGRERVLGLVTLLIIVCLGIGATASSTISDGNSEDILNIDRDIDEGGDVIGEKTKKSGIAPPYLKYMESAWVDSVYSSLSLKERVAQLIMAPLYSNKSISSQSKVISAIREYNLGGVIFFQGGPVRQANMVNYIQSIAKTPMLVSTDAEWGLDMRLDSAIHYPYNIGLGAIQDEELLYRMGKELGEQSRRIGVNINFAPVVDVNNNPDNPVIGFRSYGEDPENVGSKASAFIRGMQSTGVLAVAKHFPGHGDTSADSHFSLPVINHDRSHLEKLEFVPFKRVIDCGIGGVMSAHLNLPKLEPIKGLPSTLSKTILTGILREDLGYSGLIFTDAMNMKGLTSSYPAGVVEPMALNAGNDVLETVTDPKLAIEGILKAVDNGTLSMDLIETKCKKVLALKFWCGLNKKQEIDTKSIIEDINSPKYQEGNRRLAEASITVVKNSSGILPIRNLGSNRVAVVMLGQSSVTLFKEMCARYGDVEIFALSKKASDSQLQQLYKKLEQFDIVVGAVDGLSVYASKKFAISESQKRAVSHISKSGKGVITIFGNPYALRFFPDVEYAESVVLPAISSEDSHRATAQLIFGSIGADGVLPITIDSRFRVGMGECVEPLGRLRYSMPESLGINSILLKSKIDSIATNGIEKGAFPGCQVLVAKEGRVIFEESYGYHTYDKKRAVEFGDMFDFASLTKISGPLPILMQLCDRGVIDLGCEMSEYWPRWKSTDKKSLKMRDILAHQAHLIPYIPFWTRFMECDTVYNSEVLAKEHSSKYPVVISRTLGGSSSMRDTIYKVIDETPLLNNRGYKYSGMSFLVFPEMIGNLTGVSYESYLHDSIFAPLGASTIMFNPASKVDVERVVPTERDDIFRKEQLKGYVHDEAAALLGGVSGNAGLFGTIEDCAKLAQMYMNMGEYGGDRFISEATMQEFTKRQFTKGDNRRALGFDKPFVNNHKNSVEDAYPAYSSSSSSFGHTGYTGTMVWIDPESELIFIIFSNRVYPTRENNKITRLNIRTGMHQTIYDVVAQGL